MEGETQRAICGQSSDYWEITERLLEITVAWFP